MSFLCVATFLSMTLFHLVWVEMIFRWFPAYNPISMIRFVSWYSKLGSFA